MNAKADRPESVYYALVSATQIPKLTEDVMAQAHIEAIEDLIPSSKPSR